MIYYDLPVPIPEGVSSYSNGRVFYKIRYSDGRPAQKVDIGRVVPEDKLPAVLEAHARRHPGAAEKDADGCAQPGAPGGGSGQRGWMYPNSKFMLRHEDEILKEYPDYKIKDMPRYLCYGLFVLVLALGCSTGVYPLLCEIFGAAAANGIMDFAMYCIMFSESSLKALGPQMLHQFVFSIRTRSAEWYSETFREEITGSRVSCFMQRWTGMRIRDGLKSVVICPGGEGMDWHTAMCSPEDAIWAVEADGSMEGMPVACCSSPGGRPSPFTVEHMVAFVRGMGLKVDGILGDPDLCETFMPLLQETDVPCQLGMDAAEELFSRMRSEDGVPGVLFALFIAAVLRRRILNMLEEEKEEHGTSVRMDVFVSELNSINCVYSGGTYVFNGLVTALQKRILAKLGIQHADLERFEVEFNLLFRDAADSELESLRSEPRQFPEEVRRRKQGRKPGSKGKVKQAASESEPKPDSEAQDKGSPENEGSTAELKTAPAGQEEECVPDSKPAADAESAPGHGGSSKSPRIAEPPASSAPETDSPHVEKDESASAESRGDSTGNAATVSEKESDAGPGENSSSSLPDTAETPKVHKGRVKGRKNNSTLRKEAELAARIAAGEVIPEKVKRPRGRPPGAKNKTTLIQEEEDRKLSELTGIDILGTPPPLPWTNLQRNKIKRERAARRRKAEEKLRAMQESD